MEARSGRLEPLSLGTNQPERRLQRDRKNADRGAMYVLATPAGDRGPNNRIEEDRRATAVPLESTNSSPPPPPPCM